MSSDSSSTETEVQIIDINDFDMSRLTCTEPELNAYARQEIDFLYDGNPFSVQIGGSGNEVPVSKPFQFWHAQEGAFVAARASPEWAIDNSESLFKYKTMATNIKASLRIQQEHVTTFESISYRIKELLQGHHEGSIDLKMPNSRNKEYLNVSTLYKVVETSDKNQAACKKHDEPIKPMVMIGALIQSKSAQNECWDTVFTTGARGRLLLSFAPINIDKPTVYCNLNVEHAILTPPPQGIKKKKAKKFKKPRLSSEPKYKRVRN